MGFSEKYWELRNEGLTDKQIARCLNISPSTLYVHKRVYGIKSGRMNRQGMTQEQLVKGESIGLTRRTMYRRVRERNYKPNEACSVPPEKHLKRRK